jgi:hypothetical protein
MTRPTITRATDPNTAVSAQGEVIGDGARADGLAQGDGLVVDAGDAVLDGTASRIGLGR